MRLDRRQDADVLRQARDAETAHLDAVLKTHGAAYLRLAALAEALRATGELTVELRALPGEAPALWLDLVHAVTMEPDARTFRVTRHGGVDKLILFESAEQTEVLAMAKKLQAHGQVQAARQDSPAQSSGAFVTAFYIWLTGLVTGAAGLAIYLIYLKKIQF